MRNFITVIEETAKTDIRNAHDWYEMQEKCLGKRFARAVKVEINRLKKFPFSSQNRYSNDHTAIILCFNYLIHYYIQENISTFYIFAVIHTSLNPDNWEKRRI